MKVKLFATFRDICNDNKVVEVPTTEDSTVMDILEALIRLYPGLEEEVFTQERTLKPFVHVFINGRNVLHEEGLLTKVKSDDQFALFPPVAGG